MCMWLTLISDFKPLKISNIASFFRFLKAQFGFGIKNTFDKRSFFAENSNGFSLFEQSRSSIESYGLSFGGMKMLICIFLDSLKFISVCYIRSKQN